MNENKHIKWSASTTRVNAETGEILTEKQARKLIKIKTTKHVRINNNQTKGNIEYTTEYRRDSQLSLFTEE